MAKYIIDIPDEKTYLYVNDKNTFKNTFLRMPISAGENDVAPISVPTLLRIKPYTEPDKEQIENNVWDFASMLMRMHPDVAEDIYWSMNGGKGIGVAAEMTYQEAKSKYETWKKKKEKIRVGDEVEYECCETIIRFVVCGIDNGIAYGFKCWPDSFEDLDIGEYCGIDELKKTGRHFPEVEELLKKMSEEG